MGRGDKLVVWYFAFKSISTKSMVSNETCSPHVFSAGWNHQQANIPEQNKDSPHESSTSAQLDRWGHLHGSTATWIDLGDSFKSEIRKHGNKFVTLLSHRHSYLYGHVDIGWYWDIWPLKMPRIGSGSSHWRQNDMAWKSSYQQWYLTAGVAPALYG